MIKKLLIVVLLILLLFFLIFSPLTFYLFWQFNTLFVSCDYYENYTIEDWTWMKFIYKNSGYHLHDLNLIDIFFIQYYKEGEHFDCNDISFVKMCLYEKEGYECDTWTEMYFNHPIYEGFLNFQPSFETICEYKN